MITTTTITTTTTTTSVWDSKTRNQFFHISRSEIREKDVGVDQEFLVLLDSFSGICDQERSVSWVLFLLVLFQVSLGEKSFPGGEN